MVKMVADESQGLRDQQLTGKSRVEWRLRSELGWVQSSQKAVAGEAGQSE